MGCLVETISATSPLAAETQKQLVQLWPSGCGLLNTIIQLLTSWRLSLESHADGSHCPGSEDNNDVDSLLFVVVLAITVFPELESFADFWGRLETGYAGAMCDVVIEHS